MHSSHSIRLYILYLGQKKDKIKNLGTNKAYQKICLVAKNLLAAIAFLIAYHGYYGIVKPDLVTKLKESPRTFLHFIPHHDQLLSLLLG